MGCLARTKNLLTKGQAAGYTLEVMMVNAAVSNLIREAKTHQLMSLMQIGKGRGNTLLNDALATLVTSKKVEYGEAFLKSTDKEDLKKRLEHSLPGLDALDDMFGE